MKRAYVQSTRAQAAQETGARILAAAYARFSTAWYDEVTLDQIAAVAEVSVQTVLRRFGSKEGLVRALTDEVAPQVRARRDAAPVGDLRCAVADLVEHYESEGATSLHLLHQERRVPAFAEVADLGRRLHAEWCARVFAPWLDGRTGVDRQRRMAQVVAMCDVYTWYLLRRQQGLSRRQTEQALVELLEGVL